MNPQVRNSIQRCIGIQKWHSYNEQHFELVVMMTVNQFTDRIRAVGGNQCGLVFLVRSKYVISLAEFPDCGVPIELVLKQPRGVLAFTNM
jgi:hypothetical protein